MSPTLRLFGQLVLLIVSTTITPANAAYSKWPQALKDFPDVPASNLVHSSLKVGGFVVTFNDAPWKTQEEEGGTGGHVVEITVQAASGKRVTASAQWVGARILEKFDGWPQLEIWGRAGGGSWCRVLYRMMNGEYKAVRVDDFSDTAVRSKQPNITATLPREDSSFTLYYVDTRNP